MFYNSRIENFYSANEKTYKNFKFLHPVNQPMFFYDVPSIEEVSGSGLSKVNRYEAERITDEGYKEKGVNDILGNNYLYANRPSDSLKSPAKDKKDNFI